MLLRSGLTALEAALTELARSSTRPSTSFEASVVDLDPNFERKQNSMLTDSLSSLSTTTDQTVHEVVNSLVGKIIDEQIADPDTIRLNKRNSEQTSLRYLDECRALVEQIPEYFDSGMPPVQLTCSTVSKNYFVAGSNCGALFIFNRSVNQSVLPLRTKPAEAITCIRLHSSAAFEFLAVGHCSGKLVILSLPTSNGHKKLRQHINQGAHHGKSINILCWTTDGTKLFSSDESGNLFLTHIDFESDSFPVELVTSGTLLEHLVSHEDLFAFASKTHCRIASTKNTETINEVDVPSDLCLLGITVLSIELLLFFFENGNLMTLKWANPSSTLKLVGNIVEDHSSQIERYHLSTVYDESTYDYEDDFSINESVPTRTIPFYGGMAIVSQNILFIQSPKSDQNVLCSYIFDLEKISGICDIEVLVVAVSNVEEMFLLTNRNKIFRLGKSMALLALKAFHGTPKHNKITSKSKLLSGLVNVFSKKPLEGLNGDLINRFNRELDRFLLGEISLEQKKKEVPQTNADSEYPVIDVPCENNDDKDKPESTETVTNVIFSTLGISDEYSSKLVSRLNGMVDQVKQSSLMTTDYTTTKNPLNDECDETSPIKEDQITIDHTSTFTDDSRDSIADFVCSPSSREENNNGTMVAIRRKKVYAKAKTSPKNLSQPLKPESEEKREENEYSQDVKTEIDETTQILLNPNKNRIPNPKPESEEKREENEDSQYIITEIDETTQILLNPKKNRIPKPESEEKREENEDSQDIKTEIDETTQILLNVITMASEKVINNDVNIHQQMSSSIRKLLDSPSVNEPNGEKVSEEDEETKRQVEPDINFPSSSDVEYSASPSSCLRYDVTNQESSSIQESHQPNYEDVEFCYKVETFPPSEYNMDRDIGMNRSESYLSHESHQSIINFEDEESCQKNITINFPQCKEYYRTLFSNPPEDLYAKTSRILNNRTDVWVCITAPFKISNFDVSSDLLVVCPPVPWLFTTDKDVPHYQLLSEIESFGADSEGELCGFGTWVPLKVNASALALNVDGSLIWRIHNGKGYAPVLSKNNMPQAQDDHIPRLLSRIQSKEWFEKTNTPHEGYILSAALTSHHAWYLSDQGVFVQMNLPKMGILYRAEYNGPKISQLVASDYAVWALQEDGCLISRIGMNVRCPMGHAWKANDSSSRKYVSISLFDQTGFALDIVGNIWFTDNVSSIHKPFGSGVWFKVNLYSSLYGFSSFSKWRIKACPSGLFLNVGPAILFSKQAVTGHHFDRVVPHRLSLVDNFSFLTAGAFSDESHSRIYVCQPKSEIFAFSNGNFTSLPPLPLSSTTAQICASQHSLFVLNTNGEVYRCAIRRTILHHQMTWVRLKMDTTDPFLFEIGPHKSIDILSFVASTGALWAITIDSTILMCRNHQKLEEEDNYDNLQWTVVDLPEHSGNELIDRIRISSTGKHVWIFSSESGSCWARREITSENLIGHSWAKAYPDIRVEDLAIGESAVWALAKNTHKLYRLRSASFQNPAGLYWKPLEHFLRAISVDSTHENRLWGLDMQNHIVRHLMDIFPRSCLENVPG